MNLDFEASSIFLKDYTPLIHKVLQQLNIPQNHMDYEDYFQELQIKLIEILQNFKNDSADLEEKNAKFVAYAGRGLYWHGLDLLGKKTNLPFDTVDNDYIDWLANHELADSTSFESNLSTEDFFHLAKKRLSEKEYLLLIQLAEGQHTMQELADEYGVARDTIYQWKHKIQNRLEGIKDCLRC